MANEKQAKILFSKEVKSPEERWLVRKLDFVILTYCCISSFFNYLDRAAFANAYVAGLREDLQLSGRDYNVVLSLFTAGSVIGQIPHGVAIQRVPPRVWLPSMVLVWAGLTMCTAACRTYAQLCAVRFLQGLAEASTYCGTIYIIGSWYRPCEIAKRTAVFTASGQAGSMFAGLMMTAVHKGMAGYGGLAGWQWLFIINGIITCPVAIGGLLYFPDTPELTRAKWLSKAERQLALDRLPPKRADGHNIGFNSLVKRTFASPALYILCAFAVICGALEAFVVQNLFLLWLKFYDGHFIQSQINTFPLGVQAVGIVSNFLAAVHIDATGKRVPMGILACALQLVSAIVLLVPTISFPWTFFAHYLAGTSYMVNPVSYGWANIILQRGGDDALRSVTLYAMNAASTCLYTFWGIVLYPASDAPYWRNGYIAMIVVVFATLAMVWVVNRLDEWTLAQHSAETPSRDQPSMQQEQEHVSGQSGQSGPEKHVISVSNESS
ncbi:pantothenate transporter liz1 [Apiospora saccharicola]|uniref:Pantothenate transporter liz1 n=1 Tax=Apiospora saccharicola TaxID=335842 RepID=A0ABR1U5A5_9PEZI